MPWVPGTLTPVELQVASAEGAALLLQAPPRLGQLHRGLRSPWEPPQGLRRLRGQPARARGLPCHWLRPWASCPPSSCLGLSV